MDVTPLALETVLSQEFMQNAYVLWDRQQRQAVVIDPGFATEPIVDLLSRRALTLRAIVNTHGHMDHIAGNRVLKQRYPQAELIIGAPDSEMLCSTRKNLSDLFGFAVTSPPADRLLDGPADLNFPGLYLRSQPLPGHSPGSVVLIVEDQVRPLVFAGDTLFAGSVGRTDLPGSQGELLLQGIRETLFTLDESVEVLPGHGPSTTVGRERARNPFVGLGQEPYRLD